MRVGESMADALASQDIERIRRAIDTTSERVRGEGTEARLAFAESLLPLLRQFRPKVPSIAHVIVIRDGAPPADTEGFLYVATNLGIQVFDPPGRVMAILTPPFLNASSVAFGGPNRDTLFVTAGDKVFKRAMKHHGY